MAKDIVKKPKTWKKLLLPALALLLVAGSLGFGGFYYKKYQDLKKNPVTAEQAAQAETDRILAEVGQLYDLPKDEKPSVATVKDKEQLKDQPFFAGAENGDVAVIYTQAKLAILYRPSARKIIRVSNVTLQATKPNVVILGSETGRNAVESSLANLKDSFTLLAKSDAKSAPEQTIVADVSGKNAEVAAQLASALPGAKLANLPEGEDKPANADIVIVTAAQ